MILAMMTLVLMAVTAWSQYRNGLFTSVVMLIQVFLAGLVAFNFFEPIADYLDPNFQNNALAGSEDMISLTLLFGVTLFLLRLATNHIAPDMLEQHGQVQFIGAGVVGLLTGYFAAGFLICVVQTLPLEERFLGFEPRNPGEPAHRSVFPPDRVWLALMRHAGAAPFSWKEDPSPSGDGLVDRYRTFDRHGTFELRYMRYRRGFESRPPQIYFGEFDKELGKTKSP